MQASDSYKQYDALLHYLMDKRASNELYCRIRGIPHDPFVELMDGLLEQMDPDYRRILENDYVHRASTNWWNEFYSKSTYYRLKNKALEDFARRLKR
jgi:hypothetical protein